MCFGSCWRSVDISMDGRWRWIDNVMIERFCCSIKYEDIYLKAYENGSELEKVIYMYITRYNYHRPHKTLADEREKVEIW